MYLFYLGWSPFTKGCGLKKGETYEEFNLKNYSKIEKSLQFKASDLIQEDSYKFYYYFGSLNDSLTRTGQSGIEYKQLIRRLRKEGFQLNLHQEKAFKIFNKDLNTLKSQYTRYSKIINGKEVSIQIMLGNPDESTPIALREFFDFMKDAFLNASYIHYAGHAGLGSILDFDYYEKLYKEKIVYNLNSKQLFYFDGCGTYFQTTGFYFTKKYLNNSLILISNGLTILSNLIKPGVNETLTSLLYSIKNDTEISGNTLVNNIDKEIRKSIRSTNDYPMVNINFN